MGPEDSDEPGRQLSRLPVGVEQLRHARPPDLLQRPAGGLTGGPHTLRHSYATELVRRTCDLLLVAKVLGHSHQRVTELYAHVLPEHLAAARDAVSFGPPVGPAMLEARIRWGGRRG